MAMTANFTLGRSRTLQFGTIVGYRISACFTPGAGFQNQFYVYLLEKVLATWVKAAPCFSLWR